MMRETCETCHFLVKTITLNPGSYRPMALRPEEIEAVSKRTGFYDDPHHIVMHGLNASCYKGTWDDGYEGTGLFMHELEKEVRKKRNGTCFYYPRNDGMLFPAAVELQERSSQNSQLKRTNAYSVTGLFLAAFAFLADVAIRVFWL